MSEDLNTIIDNPPKDKYLAHGHYSSSPSSLESPSVLIESSPSCSSSHEEMGVEYPSFQHATETNEPSPRPHSTLGTEGVDVHSLQEGNGTVDPTSEEGGDVEMVEEGVSMEGSPSSESEKGANLTIYTNATMPGLWNAPSRLSPQEELLQEATNGSAERGLCPTLLISPSPDPSSLSSSPSVSRLSFRSPIGEKQASGRRDATHSLELEFDDDYIDATPLPLPINSDDSIDFVLYTINAHALSINEDNETVLDGHTRLSYMTVARAVARYNELHPYQPIQPIKLITFGNTRFSTDVASWCQNEPGQTDLAQIVNKDLGDDPNPTLVYQSSHAGLQPEDRVYVLQSVARLVKEMLTKIPPRKPPVNTNWLFSFFQKLKRTIFRVQTLDLIRYLHSSAIWFLGCFYVI